MLTPIQLIDCPSPKSLNRKGIKESKAEVERLDSRDRGEDLLVLIDHLRQARSVASKKDPADVTQRSERMMMTYRPCFSVLFGQCFTLCTKKTFKKKKYYDWCRVASVKTSHACFWAKEVEHRLNEFWEIIIVFPGPVIPCIGVIKVHRPAVSWKGTDLKHVSVYLIGFSPSKNIKD